MRCLDLEYCSLAGKLKIKSATIRVFVGLWSQATSFLLKPEKYTASICLEPPNQDHVNVCIPGIMGYSHRPRSRTYFRNRVCRLGSNRVSAATSKSSVTLSTYLHRISRTRSSSSRAGSRLRSFWPRGSSSSTQLLIEGRNVLVTGCRGMRGLQARGSTHSRRNGDQHPRPRCT